MANRQNKFLIKRSNVAGKVPGAGDLLLGEMALNTADVKLFTSGTTTNSILPIGWDRVSRTGDTMTGQLTINANLTVTGSVLTNSYIDFETTTTPSNLSGRTYFDRNENALSYFPNTPANDVTINIGQESVIRVYNNTGVQINNGQACHITSEQPSVNGVPSVVLAIATGDTSTSYKYEISGIATHDIPNGSEGFITAFGLVRDLNITGVTEGSEIYLSDVNPGEFLFTPPANPASRLSLVGHLVSTGTTDAKILVELNNETGLFTLSNTQISVVTLNNASTGTRDGGEMTINGGDNTLFDVSSGGGIIVDNFTDANNPEITEVVWDTITGISVTSLTGESGTYIFMDSSGDTKQFDLSTPPTEADKRDNIYLGFIGHASNIIINNIFNTPIQLVNPINQHEDLASAIGPFSISGNRVTGISGTLELEKSSGISFIYGGNFHNDNKTPSQLNSSNLSGSTLIYATGDKVIGPSGTTIDPNNYDPDGLGTITSIPGGNNYVAHRIWHSPVNNLLTFQYGQEFYANQAIAKDNFELESFITPPGLDISAYVVSVAIVQDGESDLSNSLFVPQGKFAGTGGGGGGAVDTLQSAYDNSSQPEIVTDSTGTAVDFRIGSGADSDNLVTFQQASGTINAFITGEGNATFNGLSANTFTVTGDTQLKGIIYNTGGDIVVGNSVLPDSDAPGVNLGSTSKAFGNIFVEQIVLEGEGSDQVRITKPEQTITGDVAWQWELPYTGGTSGSLMGITTTTGGGGEALTSIWYSLSGVNMNISTDTGGTITLSAATGGGEVNTASNVGNATEIFKQKNVSNLEFRTLTGDSLNRISTIVSGDTVEIGLNEPNMILWPLVVSGNQLISGGASLLSGLTFNISPLTYIIGETLYEASASTVTLNSGDTSNDRIDVIYADVSGNTGFVEGTASLNPSKPTLDNSTQVEITFVTVPAGASTPDVAITKIYDEATGTGGGEWDVESVTANVFSASTVDAFSGTKSINFSAATDGDNILIANPTPYDTTDDNIISFYVKNHTDVWANNDEIEIEFFNTGGTSVSAVAVLKDNTYGFDGTELFNWQVISIPLGDFSLTSNLVGKVQFTARETGGAGAVNCFVDLIRFQAGAPTTSPQNIWYSFRGDDGNIVVANSSTDQLRLSGGTNINTVIDSVTKTAGFNLDDNILLTSVSSTTITASGHTQLNGTLTVEGQTTFRGSPITFGNSFGDSIDFTGRINGNFVPVNDNSSDIGNPTNFWRDLYVYNISASTISGGTFYGNGSNLTNINAFSTFSSTTAGQTSVVSDNVEDLISYSGINVNILTDDTNKILTFSGATIPPGGGEVNLGNNVGTGNEIFKDKTGTTLNFRTLVAGTNVTIGSGTTELTINATGGGTSRIESSSATTNATPTELDKIDTLADNATNIVEVYVKAYQSSGTNWGVWKRTLTVTKVSGTVVIQEENADVDKTSSGLTASSIAFAVNSGDIDIDVTGIAATTINWESGYEIIL